MAQALKITYPITAEELAEQARREPIARVRAGATASDEVATLRGVQFQRILKNEFEASLSLGGTYYLIHKLGFSNLVPRSQHPASDPAAQDAFKKTSRSA